MVSNYYQLTVEETLSRLNSRFEGLTDEEAREIGAKVGKNTIPKQKKSFYEKYLKPSINLMMIILFISALIQLFLAKAYPESGTGLMGPVLILVILFINLFIAMFQQYKVERTLEALEKLTAFKATVLRNNKEVILDADDIVPGDILILRQGDYISADARIIEANELSMDESILTGESIPVEKTTDALEGDELPIQEQVNMVFSSTFVASGSGKAVVTATGLNTEIGKITKGIATKIDREIPLQTQMNKLATGLGTLVLGIIAVLFIIALVRNTENIVNEISWLVSLAVAAIPFNFPLITTIILLTGVLHLAHEQAIMKNLSAVETMGRVSVICSDKTGTLTQNQMTVVKLYYNGKEYLVEGRGYEESGKVVLDGNSSVVLKVGEDENLELFALNAVINNNSNLTVEDVAIKKGTKRVRKVIGMPTEGALLVLAEKLGVNYEDLRKTVSVLKEFSFSSERKRMSKIVEKNGVYCSLMKGAPEKIIGLCNRILVDGNIQVFGEDLKAEILSKIENDAAQGLRNLGFSYKRFEGVSRESLMTLSVEEAENEHIFIGFVSMLDPPREGVKEAVKICHDAHIQVAMITGDHPLTARSIAKDLGIYREGDNVALGSEIKNLSPEEIEKVTVFARVAPEDKQIIVKALQARNHIVAMTGDGVNDALALEFADVGIAMGISGTDVAKNAADLILTDDSFATIKTAIYHGRGLFNNIRSNIVFLLVCNLMELTVLTVISLTLGERIFLSTQLMIFYSTVHFFPPLGLMFDKYDPNIMKRPPMAPDEPVINKNYKLMMTLQIIAISASLIIIWLLTYYNIYPLFDENLRDVQNIRSVGYAYNGQYITLLSPGGLDLIRNFKANTMAFVSLYLSEIWVALESRSDKTPLWKAPKNWALYIFIALLFGILYLITHLDLAMAYIIIVPLTGVDWLVAILFSLPVLIITEWFKRYS